MFLLESLGYRKEWGLVWGEVVWDFKMFFLFLFSVVLKFLVKVLREKEVSKNR